MFRKLDHLMSQIERIIAASMLLIMTVLIFANVAIRFITGQTITWAEDISIYFMIIMTFFAGAYATRQNRHIAMTALYESITGRLKMIFYVFGLCVASALSIFLLITSLQVTHAIYELKGIIASMNLPKWWPYLIVNFAVLFMAIHFLQLLVRFFQTRKVDNVLELEE